ncbi:restriction endonuclease subunit S [Parabacteroides sp. OttesenSCG-928-J18]|nr:restriction endonuclease subunit S [Parabacteroides sp. OttesenSCG-928-J18]
MKCIDEEIPFEIPESWEWARLGSIARTILYGVSESAQTEGNYKLLRITDIQNNTVNWGNVPFATLPEDKAMEYLLKKDDILFARTGATVGKSYLVNEVSDDTIYASYLIRVRLFEIFESQYIKFFFESGFYWTQITDKSVGVGQSNVNGTSLKSLLIPVPPYEEQIQIEEQALMLTNIIDNIDNSQNLLADSIKNIKSKILDLAIRGKLVPQDPNDEPASELLERIKAEQPESKKKAKNISDNSHYPFRIPKSWEWCQISDFSLLLSGRDLSSPEYSDTPIGIPYITGASNIIKDKLNINRWTNSPKVISEKNDILITCKGTIGEIVINNIGRAHIARQLMAIRVSNSTDIYYIRYCLNLCIKQIKEQARGIIPGISREDILLLCIPVPPINEQKRIIKRIEEIFSSLDEIEKSIRA